VPDVLGEGSGERSAARHVAVGDLVADAPEDDRGRVPVAEHHRGDVALPPILKEEVVVVGILAGVPAIEGLLHQQHAQTIARVDKRARDRVVRRPDRIVPVRLEQRRRVL